MTKETLFLEGDALFESGDFLAAFSRFLQAAESGDSNCMLRVASMYTNGEGVRCDYDRAVAWELKAVGAGNVSAMVNVGISYRIKGDLVNAKHWFEQALAAGDGSGALELAKLYRVSEKETGRVVEYLKLALANPQMCQADIEDAQQLLAEAMQLRERVEPRSL
jgi:TPR repeat protein